MQVLNELSCDDIIFIEVVADLKQLVVFVGYIVFFTVTDSFFQNDLQLMLIDLSNIFTLFNLFSSQPLEIGLWILTCTHAETSTCAFLHTVFVFESSWSVMSTYFVIKAPIATW